LYLFLLDLPSLEAMVVIREEGDRTDQHNTCIRHHYHHHYHYHPKNHPRHCVYNIETASNPSSWSLIDVVVVVGTRTLVLDTVLYWIDGLEKWKLQ
jgi:hypothetical protein